ncbi:C39 family peptidase [Emcibacter sp.]|uniref:C39 family peptidase n=1 Tax=Emcibacter sp. TaxID=1979954 RepID=UPI002AA61760|nr:C39 family peptidase [Emcibacter sp.]
MKGLGILFILFTCLGGGTNLSGAAEMEVRLPGGAVAHVEVNSIREQRFRDVVEQRYDMSCGSGALATLLTYHYGQPVAEEELFVAMFKAGDQQAIREKGFSLLDIKKYLENQGYVANGFYESLDTLKGVGIPAIVLINLGGYQHFVVVKGVTDSEVLVGDPAFGLRIYDRTAFEAMWNGLLFVIENKMQLARPTFNLASAWSTRPKAPLRDIRATKVLMLQPWMLKSTNEF